MNAIAKPGIPAGYMEDPRGALIPESKVKVQHKLEDELVRTLVGMARIQSQKLAELKSLALGETAEFKAQVAQEYGATKGGAKGNMTLTSYDGRLRVKISVSETLSFGPELAAAKELIDGCILRWSEGANDNIRALIDQAFQVNKSGRIDTHRVLALRRLDIEDEDWARAMDAIGEALRVTGSKTYVRFYDVDPATDQEVPIPLDLANV